MEELLKLADLERVGAGLGQEPVVPERGEGRGDGLQRRTQVALAVLPPLDLSRHAATISPVCLPSPGAEPEPDYGEDYDSDYGTAYGWGKQRLSYYETKRHFGLEKGKASGLSTVLQKLEFE